MTIKAKDFDTIIHKLGFESRKSGDLLAWFEYKGKVIVRTKRSKKKGQDLPFQHSIRQQMKLHEEQMREAIRCTFTREDYIKLLKDKGLIVVENEQETTGQD